jgi:hypothetical protein
MGIFSSLSRRNAYVPPANLNAPTLLTGGDPNLYKVSDSDPPVDSGDDDSSVQVAQQRPVALQQQEPTHALGASNDGAMGQAVELPDGSHVPDRYSPTGELMSPVADLSDVAASGRNAAQNYRRLMIDPMTREQAGMLLLKDYFTNIGTGGNYDFQRRGNQFLGPIFGFTQLPHFRNVSNVNVGLFCQQAGMSLEDTLTQAGKYARLFSKNAKPDQPYGLDSQTAEFIKTGFNIGKSNVFHPRASR